MERAGAEGSGLGRARAEGSGAEDADHPLHESPKTAPAAAHYLGALVITAIVTGLAFLIKDPPAKWTTFGVAVAMDLGVLLAAAIDAARSRSAP